MVNILRNNRNFSYKRVNHKIVPNCFIIENKPIKRASQKVLKILSVGRFHYAKDYRTSLEAVKIVSQKVHLFYKIVGWGELEQDIRQWIANLDMKEIIEIVINPHDLAFYYEEADVFLQTSIFEGLSNTIMEAMSFTLPVVTTDVGDNNRLVIHGETGYLCGAGNVEQIAEQLERLSQDSERRVSMGLKGYDHLKLNYSMSIFQQQYFDFIARERQSK